MVKSVKKINCTNSSGVLLFSLGKCCKFREGQQLYQKRLHNTFSDLVDERIAFVINSLENMLLPHILQHFFEQLGYTT